MLNNGTRGTAIENGRIFGKETWEDEIDKHSSAVVDIFLGDGRTMVLRTTVTEVYPSYLPKNVN